MSHEADLWSRWTRGVVWVLDARGCGGVVVEEGGRWGGAGYSASLTQRTSFLASRGRYRSVDTRGVGLGRLGD